MNLIGAGGHAKVVIDILQELGETINGVWDDNTSLKKICGIDIKGTTTDLANEQKIKILIAVGSNDARYQLAKYLNFFEFGNAFHPKSFISKHAKVGEGSVVMANATINILSQIGCHTIINTNASVDHDCYLHDFVHVSPNAALAGNVEIGEGTQVGIGAAVIQNIRVGKWATIGAGSVVINNIPDYAVVVGVPAKIIKYNKYEN